MKNNSERFLKLLIKYINVDISKEELIKKLNISDSLFDELEEAFHKIYDEGYKDGHDDGWDNCEEKQE